MSFPSMITGSETLQTLVRNLSTHGNRPAILTFHKHTVDTRSFAELSEEVRRLASGLLHAGLLKDETVAIYAPNGPEWIIACLASLFMGAVPTPIDSQMAGEDLSHVVEDCMASRIITTRTLADRLTSLGLHKDRSIILLDTDNADPQSWQHFRREPLQAVPSVRPDDQAVLFYTSGVSDRPKGVPLSHRNLLANLQALLEARVYRPDERLLLPLPLHHAYPFMVGLLAPFTLGLPIVLPHSLTGPQILRALREEKRSGLSGWKTCWTRLLRSGSRACSLVRIAWWRSSFHALHRYEQTSLTT